MLNLISISFAGFSIIAVILLIIQRRPESKASTILAKGLLFALLGIQLIHILYITEHVIFGNIVVAVYVLLLGLVGPLFYLYSHYIIQSDKKWTSHELWYLSPAIVIASVCLFSTEAFHTAYALTFLLGGIYMIKLAWSLYLLRSRRSLFKMEFIFISSFLTWSIIIVILGIFSIQSISLLIPVQSIMLALAIIAAIHIQLNYPHLLSSLEEIAHRQYQTSTLDNIDREKIKQQLEILMLDKKVYQDSDLSLSSLAENVSLKPHQLSEFLNSHLGISFSSYIRGQRVKAAEVLLKDEPKISVLAISLSVGFSSQSAFYSAFNEIHSLAPGQYRKKHFTQ